MGIDGVEVMFALPNEHVPFTRPTLTGSLYLKTDQVNTLWEKLKDRCQVEYPLEDFEYGMREFAIRDNSGYLLQFGQERHPTGRRQKSTGPPQCSRTTMIRFPPL